MGSFLVLGGDILGGDVGLAISNCILLTGMLQWGVRQSAEVRTRLISEIHLTSEMLYLK